MLYFSKAIQPIELGKRFWNRTANWFSACFHVVAGIVHLSDHRVISQEWHDIWGPRTRSMSAPSRASAGFISKPMSTPIARWLGSHELHHIIASSSGYPCYIQSKAFGSAINDHFKTAFFIKISPKKTWIFVAIRLVKYMLRDLQFPQADIA